MNQGGRRPLVHQTPPKSFRALPVPIGDDADASLQDHKATNCMPRLPARHKFPCVGCRTPGHMTPANRRCDAKIREEWNARHVLEQKSILEAAKQRWIDEYKLLPKLSRDIGVEDLGADFVTDRAWCTTSTRASGGIDTVLFPVTAESAQHLTWREEEGAILVCVALHSTTHAALIVRSGYRLHMIDSAPATLASAEALATTLSGSATAKLIFTIPDPPALAQGWAIHPPDIQRPSLSFEQTVWLLHMINRPGKLPPDHIFSKMEDYFDGKHLTPERRRPHLVMRPPRRLKAFISRYIQMKKKNAFTKQVAAARDVLEKANWHYDAAAVEAAKHADSKDDSSDDSGDDHSDLDQDDEGDGRVASGDSGDEQEDDADAIGPAPSARGGFTHASVFPSSRTLQKGDRLQYRFDGKKMWLACVVKAVDNERRHPRYTITAEDELHYQNVALTLCEHGASKKWVFWQPDSRVAGDPSYAVLSLPDTEVLLPAPQSPQTDMDAYIKERLSNAGNEYVYYNWMPPYDWLRGVCLSKHRNKHTITVKWDKTPKYKNGFNSHVKLAPAQYGVRRRWVVASKQPR